MDLSCGRGLGLEWGGPPDVGSCRWLGLPYPTALLRAGCSSSSAQTPHSRQLESPLPLTLLRGWGHPPRWAAAPRYPAHLGVNQDLPLSPLCLPRAV